MWAATFVIRKVFFSQIIWGGGRLRGPISEIMFCFEMDVDMQSC